MDPLPLSALLSQALVAFTVELDNEFERRMLEEGYPGRRLSLMLWMNLMRFIAEDGISVRELSADSLLTQEAIRHQLGCLERWGFVSFGESRRDGWGSGRGIRGDLIVRLSPAGLLTIRIWPAILPLIEQRWERRFGAAALRELRRSLAAVVDGFEFELPQGVPAGLPLEAIASFPPRDAAASSSKLPLPVLLSQALLAFAVEFDRQSRVPMLIAANVVRVVDPEGVRLSDLPRLTGGSPETTAIGWRLKSSGCVTVVTDPAMRRGKLVCLTTRGVAVQEDYRRLTSEIEQRWKSAFGASGVEALRSRLDQLDPALLAKGLEPPTGTVRAGGRTPALGRRSVGVAAQQRGRDLVEQTADFVRDPRSALPHYPMWDMNRGFGP